MNRTAAQFTVRIRRNIGRTVRPEAEVLDGKTFRFRIGWVMGGDDPYPGEYAMIPEDSRYPVTAPPWIASGDLCKEPSPNTAPA